MPNPSLTNEEELLLEFGSPGELIDYCMFNIKCNCPRITDRVGLKKAVAHCIKKYGSNAVLISSKTVRGLNDSNLFPKLVYMSNAYFSSEKYASSNDPENVKAVLEFNKISSDSDRMRKMLLDPTNSIISLFCEGKVTHEEYTEACESEQRCIEVIKRVLGGN